MALIKCTECGHSISDRASSCPNCGCPIAKGRYCEECGSVLSSNDKVCPTCGCPVGETTFCKECGEPLNPMDQTCPSCGYPVDKKKKGSIALSSNKRRWAIVGLSAVIAIGVMAAGLYKFFSDDGFGGITGLFSGDDSTKEVHITPEFIAAVRTYDQLEAFSEGMAAVGRNGKWGYINTNGKEIIPCQYDSEYEEYGHGASSDKKYGLSHPFHEGVAVVCLNGKWGVVDKKGNVIIEYGQYQVIDDCHEGLLRCRDFNDIYVFVDKKGKKVFTAKEYIPVKSFHDGFCLVRKDDLYGYINKRGELTIPCKYQSASSFSEGKAVVSSSSKGFSCINQQGKVLYTKKDLNSHAMYHEGLLEVQDCKSFYCGFINESGEIVIPCKYRSFELYNAGICDSGIFPFNEGYTYVYDSSDSNFYLDNKGNHKYFAYAPINGWGYDHRVFSEGLACVGQDEVGFMDVMGKLVIPFKYNGNDDLHYSMSETYGVFHNGVALVRIGDQWGYVDKQGNDTFLQTDIDAYQEKLKREEEERRLEEERARLEEERVRLEEERRPKERIVYLRGYLENWETQSWEGNCGAKRNGTGTIRSDFIKIPEGKVWILQNHKYENTWAGEIYKKNEWINNRTGKNISEMKGERFYEGQEICIACRTLTVKEHRNYTFEVYFLEKTSIYE